MPASIDILKAIKAKDWSAANEAFASVLNAKVADRLAVERKSVFKEAVEPAEYRIKAGNKYWDGKDRWVDSEWDAQSYTENGAATALNKLRINGASAAKVVKEDVEKCADCGKALIGGYKPCKSCGSTKGMGPAPRAEAVHPSKMQKGGTFGSLNDIPPQRIKYGSKKKLKKESLASEPSDGDAIRELGASEASIKESAESCRVCHKPYDEHTGYHGCCKLAMDRGAKKCPICDRPLSQKFNESAKSVYCPVCDGGFNANVLSGNKLPEHKMEFGQPNSPVCKGSGKQAVEKPTHQFDEGYYRVTYMNGKKEESLKFQGSASDARSHVAKEVGAGKTIVDVETLSHDEYVSESWMPTKDVQRVFDNIGDIGETELLCGVRRLKVNDQGQVVSFVSENYTKRALIREPGHPIGQAAPMYINCVCGKKIDGAGDGTVECTKCGRAYDQAGYIVREATVSEDRVGAGDDRQGWKTLKVIPSHSGLAKWLHEVDPDGDNDAGWVKFPTFIPSPYMYSRYRNVYNWNGKKVIRVETSHKRYEIIEVPKGEPILPKDPDA